MRLMKYTKSFTLDGERHTLVTSRYVTKEELEEVLFYVRRLIGYTLYPRWCATRMFLAEVLEMVRRNGYDRHKVRRATRELLREYDRFEKLHVVDFDEEFIDVMGGSMSSKVLPKIGELRGSIGGVLLRRDIKNYVFYSYPETLVVLCQNNVSHFDVMMGEVRERYGFDLSGVFGKFRGGKVLGCAYMLMSALEDMVGEVLPMNVDATGTGADEKLHTFDRMLVDVDNLRDAILAAIRELPEDKRLESQGIIDAWSAEQNDNIVAQLSTKYSVKRV